MSVNKLILLGNVGKDPEYKKFDGGSKVARFSLATTTKFNETEETEWHSIVFWGDQADSIQKWVKKGQQLYVEGTVKYKHYTHRTQGHEVYYTEILGFHFQMIGGKKEDNKPPLADPQAATTSFKADPKKTEKTEKKPERSAAEQAIISGFDLQDNSDDYPDMPNEDDLPF